MSCIFTVVLDPDPQEGGYTVTVPILSEHQGHPEVMQFHERGDEALEDAVTPTQMPLIYHVAGDQDWREAQRVGEYRISTRGRTLDEEGFIHCSRASQVAQVANRFYAGQLGLVLLTIDPERVTAEVRYEAVPGWDEPFAHVYGPLNTDAVIRVSPFEPGPNGTFAFNAEAQR